jgi:hypothetical protein
MGATDPGRRPTDARGVIRGEAGGGATTCVCEVAAQCLGRACHWSGAHLYLPYVAETQDEKMFRVVRDRERWFQIVMGENYEVDEAATDRRAERIPLPESVKRQLSMSLHVESADGSIVV